jgi:O-antigen/teichoic acid export membrane protein
VKILKNIFGVAMTNIVNFGTSFLINFMLPLILSVVDYGNYRQYILYMSFTYIFNAGFNDGIYIKYGGKEDHELDRETVHEEHSFLFIFQSIIFILMLAYSIWQRNIIFGLFSTATFFNAINVYHQNFLQATGKFGVFTRGNILKSIFNIIILLIAIFIFQFDNYVVYIIIHVLAFIFLFIFYEYYYIKDHGLKMTFNPSGKFDIFRVGVFILIANMSLTFVGNVGSWIVNWRYSIENFAQYSFQNSVLNVILLIVNAVGMVFYNVISRRRDERLLGVIKNASIYLGIGAGLAFFLFKVIIQIFFPQYTSAISLLSITFIAIPYIMTSKILMANLYKATVPEKKYFRDSVLYAGGAFVLVFVADLIFGNMQAIAFATTAAYILWFLYTTRSKFYYLKSSGKELFLLASHFVIFFIAANYFTTGVGFLIYLVYIALAILFNREEIKHMVLILKE